MALIGGILAILGLLLIFVGSIWLLIRAFQVSILWGLGSLFIPFVGLIFVILHWGAAKQPFLIMIGGIVLSVIGSVLGGGSGMPAGMPTMPGR